MHSFDIYDNITVGGDECNERLQARLLDSVQFRLQQQINLKDDEISQLKSDLALIQGEVETLSDTLKAKQKPFKDSTDQIQKQISLVKEESQLKLIHCKKTHANNLQKLDQKFSSEIRHLQRKLEKRILRNVTNTEINDSMNEKKSQRSKSHSHSKRKNHITQDQEIDNFLQSVEAMKLKTNQKIKKSEKVKKIVTQAELKLNEKKYADLTSKIANYEKQKQELGAKISEQKDKLDGLQNTSVSDLDDDIDNEIDDNQAYFDENIKPYNDRVDKAQKKLEEVKQDQGASLKKLKKKIQLEQEKIKNKREQMNDKIKETEALQKKIEQIQQKQKEELEAAKAAKAAEEKRRAEEEARKAAEEKRKAEEEARKAAEEARKAEAERKRIEKERKEAYERKYGRLFNQLKTMTTTQKEECLQMLTEENKALKREIYRIDNMIYGKSGKYRGWKDI